MYKKIYKLVKEEYNLLINENNISNKIWYHGTDKKIKGKPKKNGENQQIKTNLGNLNFSDFLNSFFVTTNYNWAEFYAPKTKNVYKVEINDNAKILDASNVVESTHLINKLLFKNIQKPSNKEFPFQKKFNEYAFKWLNKERIKNNKESINYEYFKNNLINAFNPSSEDWFNFDIGSKALFDYINDNNYDAVLFQREMAILNSNIINNINLINHKH